MAMPIMLPSDGVLTGNRVIKLNNRVENIDAVVVSSPASISMRFPC